MRATRRRAIAASAGAALAIGFIAPVAFAAGPGFHELEGDIYDTGSPDPPYDWSDIFTAGSATTEPTEQDLPASILDPDFTRDFKQNNGTYVNGDDTYFATGSKDTLDITPGWQCKRTNNATDKGDWVNAYGYAARVDHDGQAGTPDHTIFFFGLEKDDDNGTNNVGIWLLQDEEVGCVATGGGNFDFAGAHADGDLLAVVAYDSGGNVGTAQGYVWNGGLPNNPTFEQADSECTPDNIDYTKDFCIITNSGGSIASPWWSPQKNNKALNAELQTNTFVEGFLDVTGIFEGNEPCFASALANSRASTSTTAALYDFVEIEAATCGPLTIKKYFDKNGNGTKDAGEPYLSGWDFAVFPDGQGPAGTPSYSGTTAGDAGVSFADVPTGAYDVHETQKTGYYATDPGTGLKKDVTQTTAGTTVEFGNACYVDKSFTVTGVPTGVALELVYAINDPDDNGPYVTVDMTANGTSRSYTLNDTLKPTDTVDWTYQLDGNAGSKLPLVEDDEVLSDYTDTSGVGTACAKANSTTFPLATLTGTKYKDVDADGTKDAEDTGLAGFEFKLYTGSNGSAGTQVGSAVTSAANGTYSFPNVAPGTYSVVETQQAGWRQTAPVAGTPATATFRTVTVNLGDSSKSIGDFLNAPLTDLLVEVDPQTSYTFADSIQCRRGADVVGTDVDGVSGADDGVTKSVDANGLLVGTYTCTIVITDP